MQAANRPSTAFRTKVEKLCQKVARRLENLRLVDQRFAYDLWEAHTLSKIVDRFQVDCVFDVGANFGQYARMLRKHAGFRGLIVSFEPQPEAAARIRHHSKADPNWIVEEIALSTAAGTAMFNVMHGSEFSSLSSPIEKNSALFHGANVAKEQIEVPTDRLDNVLARLQAAHGFKRPFLKLDTQGFDHAIVMAGKNCLSSFVGLQSELAVTKLYHDSVGYQQALRDYEDCGFSLCSLFPNNAGHFPRLLEFDCIMCRNDLVADA